MRAERKEKPQLLSPSLPFLFCSFFLSPRSSTYPPSSLKSWESVACARARIGRAEAVERRAEGREGRVTTNALFVIIRDEIAFKDSDDASAANLFVFPSPFAMCFCEDREEGREYAQGETTTERRIVALFCLSSFALSQKTRKRRVFFSSRVKLKFSLSSLKKAESKRREQKKTPKKARVFRLSLSLCFFDFPFTLRREGKERNKRRHGRRGDRS